MTQEIQNTTPFLIWKHVPGYINIQVNQYGQVRDSGTHELKSFYEQSGYYGVSVKRVGENKAYHQYVHALIMLAFKGERPTGHHIDHKDGDKLNNVISNLRYVTLSQNQRNRKDQITVTYNGEDTVLIDALEDMFGKDCVSATSGKYGYQVYKRISMAVSRGKAFDDAIQYEITKRGWPVAEQVQAAA